MIKNLIVATAINGGIGCKGQIPWTCVPDIKRFASITKGHAVIMGRKTWDSIGKPLTDRINIVVSASGNTVIEAKDIKSVYVANSIAYAVKLAESLRCDEVFFIGGTEIYKQVLAADMVDTIYMSIIKGVSRQKFDRYFEDFYSFMDGKEPAKNLKQGWTYEIESDTRDYMFINFYRKRSSSEHDKVYFDALKNVLANGTDMPTRVGPARSLFDTTLRFDMRDGLPVITTKKMALNAIKTELCWFLKGCKNIKYLHDHNVHIWDKDAYAYYQRLFSQYYAFQFDPGSHTDELLNEFPLQDISFNTFLHFVECQYKLIFVDTEDGHSIGDLEYTFGDVGPIYGAQWINFNNSGINQIDALINTLRKDPTNRRLIISAWNPEAMPLMALPPCHYAMEFYTEPIPREMRYEIYKDKIGFVSNAKEPSTYECDRLGVPKYYLSLRWIQRSCDMALGVPFDITSYALLLSIIGNIVNMIPKNLIGSLGNTHIYNAHIPAVKNMLRRNPYLFAGSAKVSLPPQVNAYKELEPEMIQIEDYKSYQSVKFDLFTDASKQ